MLQVRACCRSVRCSSSEVIVLLRGFYVMWSKVDDKMKRKYKAMRQLYKNLRKDLYLLEERKLRPNSAPNTQDFELDRKGVEKAQKAQKAQKPRAPL